MTAEEGESGQHGADTQRPNAEDSTELLDAEQLGLCFQLPGVAGGVVVAEALGYDLSSSPIDQRESVVATWAHNDQRCQWRRHYAGLLIELGGGLACTFAQPFEGGYALDK